MALILDRVHFTSCILRLMDSFRILCPLFITRRQPSRLLFTFITDNQDYLGIVHGSPCWSFEASSVISKNPYSRLFWWSFLGFFELHTRSDIDTFFWGILWKLHSLLILHYSRFIYLCCPFFLVSMILEWFAILSGCFEQRTMYNRYLFKCPTPCRRYQFNLNAEIRNNLRKFR